MLLVLTLTVLYAVNPDLLRPETLVETLRESGQPVLLVYALLSVGRAFTLIPSTVLIIAGTLPLPESAVVRLDQLDGRGRRLGGTGLLFLSSFSVSGSCWSTSTARGFVG